MPMGYYCQRLPPDAGDCHSCIHPDNAIHSGSTEEDEELARVPSAEVMIKHWVAMCIQNDMGYEQVG